MSNYFEHSRPIWKPLERGTSLNVDLLRRDINRRRGLNLVNYHDLHKYSVEDYNFWLDLWLFLGVISSVPPTKIIQEASPVPIWFPGTKLNYAENLLHRNDDNIACTAAHDSGKVVDYSYRQLRIMVSDVASALRNAGINVGDRVAGIVSNGIYAIVIALATASCGAIFSATATDMGTQGILDRYRQITPKALFFETFASYGGKTIDLSDKISAVVRDLKSHGLEIAVALPNVVTGHPVPVEGTIVLAEFLALGSKRELTFEQLPFSHPLFILYSSGTSGPPKCIVHSAGGVLMQTQKDIRLGLDVKNGETLFQYTTTGWMMWTWVLGGLACGSRIILYDGSPFYPNLPTYLKFIHDQGVSVLGTSPRFLSEIQGQKISPLSLASFESLRCIGCTGAVLTAPVFEWTQKAFGEKVHVASNSGGTDICAAFVGGTSALPVYLGEIQAKCLGMKVEIFDLAGKNIENTGEPGELVCTRPHPSLPLKFWGDTPDGKKLTETYFNMYPGVWRQGDFIVKNTASQGLIILGRSDGVLNPSGVRFGSGEIYAVMEQFGAVVDDSLCIGQRRPEDKDERVLLFVKMRQGQVLTKTLAAKIRQSIRKALSSRHVPAYIFSIDDIPYTVNGKKIEIAVKQIVSGINVKVSGTVANPESLKLYGKFREIENVTASAKL